MQFDEQKAKTISLFIKIGIAIVAFVFLIILLSQYIYMSKLAKQKNLLNTEYSQASQQASDLTNKLDNLTGDGKNQYYTDEARDKFDYVEEDEILINKD